MTELDEELNGYREGPPDANILQLRTEVRGLLTDKQSISVNIEELNASKTKLEFSITNSKAEFHRLQKFKECIRQAGALENAQRQLEMALKEISELHLLCFESRLRFKTTLPGYLNNDNDNGDSDTGPDAKPSGPSPPPRSPVPAQVVFTC